MKNKPIVKPTLHETSYATIIISDISWNLYHMDGMPISFKIKFVRRQDGESR